MPRKKDLAITSEIEAPSNKPRVFYGWYLVAASWVMLFLSSSVMVSVYFKPMLEEFGLDRATLSLVQTVALIVFAIISPFLGRLIDRFGPRAMLFICVATQTLASTINGVATSLWHLYAARLLLEIKALHSTQVLINRWFVKKRGTALGITGTSIPIGTMVLVPLSQYLVNIWGWRTTLLFWAGVTFVVLLLLTLLIRNNPEDKGYGPDGDMLHGAKPIDTSTGPGIGLPAPVVGIATGNSIVEAARTGAFWLLALSQFICGIGCGFMFTHTVIFATDLGYTAMIGASLISVQGAVNLIGVLVTGHMSDRHSRSKVLALTHFIRCLCFVTTVIFILLGGGSLWLLYIAMAFFGFGWFTTAPLAFGLVADLFGNLRLGTLIGITLSFHMVGMAIGAYAGGITFELTGSYFRFFLVQGILEFIAAVFAFAIKRQSVVK